MLSKVVLKNRGKNGKATVYVQYIYDGKSARFPTGIKVLPEHFKDGRLTKGYDSQNYRTDNNLIDSIQTRVDSIIKGYFQKLGAAPDLSFVREEYYKEANKRKISNKTFFEYFDEYISYKEQLLTHNTIRNIKGCRNHLKKFEEKTNYKVSFETINHKFLNEYQLFSIKEKKQNSSIAHTLVFLKGFLKHCQELEYTYINNFPDLKIKNKKAQNEVIALTKDELIEIKNLKLEDPGKDYVRDLFLLMCATSLRFGDAVRLDKAKIDGKFIKTDISKTKDKVRIPLNNISREILEKYDYQMRAIDLGYFNKTIKKICEQIESLKQSVQVIKHIGSKKEVEEKSKFNLVAAHTGRRTFITNCIDTGVPITTIMKWSNHKKMDVFLRYVNKGVNEEEHMSRVFDF